jgi:hypothetical protein
LIGTLTRHWRILLWASVALFAVGALAAVMLISSP